MTLNISESATKRIMKLLQEENDPNIKLRIFVQGGGCSGLNYGFTFDSEQNEDDFTIPVGSTNLLVDGLSMQYLQGSKIDYVEDISGSRFAIENPHATSTCGCGSSFSV